MLENDSLKLLKALVSNAKLLQINWIVLIFLLLSHLLYSFKTIQLFDKFHPE